MYLLTHALTLAAATCIPVAVQAAGFLPPPWGLLIGGGLNLVANTFHLMRQSPLAPSSSLKGVGR